jgi:hypothetical protein
LHVCICQIAYAKKKYLDTLLLPFIGDYFIPKVLTKDIFKEHWTLLNDSNESSANFMLNYRNIQIAVASIIANFNLAPVQNTLSQLDGATSYKLLCSGVFTGGAIFLARCSFLYTDDHGCILKVINNVINTRLSIGFLYVLLDNMSYET